MALNRRAAKEATSIVGWGLAYLTMSFFLVSTLAKVFGPAGFGFGMLLFVSSVVWMIIYTFSDLEGE